MRYVLTATSLLLSVAFAIAGDQIILKNGNAIEGDVTHYADGDLTIRTTDGKNVTGSMQNIKEIRFSSAESAQAVAAQAPQPKAEAVPEFSSLSEIFRKLPSDLHPHKELWKTNPLLMDKLRDWFKDNAVGARLVLRSRDLMSVETSSLEIKVSDKPFSLGGTEYHTWRGIQCRYWERETPRGEEYKKLIADLQAQGKTYDDFKKQQLDDLKKVQDFLSTLTVTKVDHQGRVTQSGSKVNVTGTIESISTQPAMNEKPSHVLIHITLKDVTITKTGYAVDSTCHYILYCSPLAPRVWLTRCKRRLFAMPAGICGIVRASRLPQLRRNWAT